MGLREADGSVGLGDGVQERLRLRLPLGEAEAVEERLAESLAGTGGSLFHMEGMERHGRW